MKKGLLLINLGTSEQPTTGAIRRYLRPFLTDKRVITLPRLLRTILVYGLILPFRPKRLVTAYKSIWTDQGSPLMVYSQALLEALQKRLEGSYVVALGMRYGKPELSQALESLKNCDTLTILPLYPQYASSASGSAVEAALMHLQTWDVIPHLRVIRDFYQHQIFIQALSQKIKPYLDEETFVLFSYHGLPKNHLTTSDCSHCETPCTIRNTRCYRAQCYETTRLVAQSLQLKETQFQTSFQSRLGRTPWIQPYTTETLPALAARGIKKLVVACPSFVADCLETLEEIGEQANEQWQELTGHSLSLVPCLNNDPLFVETILSLIGEKL